MDGRDANRQGAKPNLNSNGTRLSLAQEQQEHRRATAASAAAPPAPSAATAATLMPPQQLALTQVQVQVPAPSTGLNSMFRPPFCPRLPTDYDQQYYAAHVAREAANGGHANATGTMPPPPGAQLQQNVTDTPDRNGTRSVGRRRQLRPEQTTAQSPAFGTFAQAQAYLSAPLWRPSVGTEGVPDTDADRVPYVRRLACALARFDLAAPSPSTSFFTGRVLWTPKDFVAIAHVVVDTLIRLHNIGGTGLHFKDCDANVLHPTVQERNFDFNTRFRYFERLVLKFKECANQVMRGNHVEMYLAAPQSNYQHWEQHTRLSQNPQAEQHVQQAQQPQQFNPPRVAAPTAPYSAGPSIPAKRHQDHQSPDRMTTPSATQGGRKRTKAGERVDTPAQSTRTPTPLNHQAPVPPSYLRQDVGPVGPSAQSTRTPTPLRGPPLFAIDHQRQAGGPVTAPHQPTQTPTPLSRQPPLAQGHPQPKPKPKIRIDDGSNEPALDPTVSQTPAREWVTQNHGILSGIGSEPRRAVMAPQPAPNPTVNQTPSPAWVTQNHGILSGTGSAPPQAVMVPQPQPRRRATIVNHGVGNGQQVSHTPNPAVTPLFERPVNNLQQGTSHTPNPAVAPLFERPVNNLQQGTSHTPNPAVAPLFERQVNNLQQGTPQKTAAGQNITATPTLFLRPTTKTPVVTNIIEKSHDTEQATTATPFNHEVGGQDARADASSAVQNTDSEPAASRDRHPAESMPAEPNVVDEANGASDGSNAPTDIPASGNCSSVNGPPTPTYNVENAQKGNGHTPATDMHRLNGTPTTPSNGETPENAARIPKPTPKGKQLDAGARARRSDSAAPAPET